MQDVMQCIIKGKLSFVEAQLNCIIQLYRVTPDGGKATLCADCVIPRSGVIIFNW